MAEPFKVPKQAAKQYPKPPEGTWTEHYPELDTNPVSYENSISPEFFELEREAIFKRAWLNVGRVEQLRRKGSFFTRELAVAKTSLIIVRGMDDQVRAFHNVCRHRGNKLVWKDDPHLETTGHCRQFACKYHGWRYDLDGKLSYILQEGEFFGIDKAKFRRKVVPGDQVRLEVVPLRKGASVWKMKGEARVDGEVAAEAEFLATIADKDPG